MDRPEGVSVRFLAPGPPKGFDHKYKLAYVVTLSAHELCTDVHIVNEGTEDFIFQTLLHNYLAVDDIKKVTVTGVDEGVRYRSKVHDNQFFNWQGGDVKVDGPLDR